MRVLRFRGEQVSRVQFLADPPQLRALVQRGRGPYTLHRWDLAADRAGEPYRLPRGGSRTAMARDGRLAVAGPERRGHDYVEVIDPDRPGRGWEGRVAGHVRALAFTPDGATLAASWGSADGERWECACWDAETGAALPPRAWGDPLGDLAFDPTGRLLAVTGTDQRRAVGLWDRDAGARVALLEHDGLVGPPGFSPDGRVLAAPGGPSVRLWDAAGRLLHRLEVQGRQAIQLAFSPDGRLLAGACGDGVLRLWDVASGAERCALDWGLGWLATVAFAPDGLTVAAAGEGGAVAVWDVDTDP